MDIGSRHSVAAKAHPHWLTAMPLFQKAQTPCTHLMPLQHVEYGFALTIKNFTAYFMTSLTNSSFDYRGRFTLVAQLLLFFVVAVNSAFAQDTHTWTYRVKPGDTLRSIAGRHLDNPRHWQRLQAINHLKIPTESRRAARCVFPANRLKRNRSRRPLPLLKAAPSIARTDRRRANR